MAGFGLKMNVLVPNRNRRGKKLCFKNKSLHLLNHITKNAN